MAATFFLGAEEARIPQPSATSLCVCLQVNEGDEDTDLQIFCVSCSHPVNPKVALRHMERCYAKVITCTEEFLIQKSLDRIISVLFVLTV